MGVAMLLWALQSHAQIGFSHSWVEFSPGDRTTSVVFTNEGDQPIELEFASRPRDARSQGQQLLVYPRVTQLGPGERQTIRLMARSGEGRQALTPAFFWLDYQYRHLDQPAELPSDNEATVGRVSLRTAVSIPVSYVANNAKPLAKTQLVNNHDGSTKGIVIANEGDAALRIYKMQRGSRQATLKMTILPGDKAMVDTLGAQPPFRFFARNHSPIVVN